MSRPLEVLIVGTGRLAAILAGAACRSPSRDAVALMGRNAEARDRIIAANLTLCVGVLERVPRADLVVLAISPDGYREEIERLAPLLSPSTVLVSVTNGVRLEELAGWTANPVVKAIPTIAQVVGRGAVPLVAGPRATPADVARVADWFGRFGRPVAVSEDDIRVASNVAGSAVAALASFAHAFVAANARHASALDAAAIAAMMAETLGAVGELARAGVGFDRMIESTATPGGFTEAMLEPLTRVVDAVCEEMVDATFARQGQIQEPSSRV